MSTGEFSGVDHDLLADYLGGALDGTAEHAEVARLVAEEPAWAQAHALMAPAVEGVRAELAAWGEPVPELPPEIADRILSALATADPPTVAVDEVDPAVVSTVGTASTGGKSAVVPAQPVGGPRRPGPPRPATDRGVPSRPGRRRRRWARVAGPVALAAAAVVGLGALQLSRPHQGDETTSGTALNDRGTGPVVPHAYPQDSAGDAATGTAPERALAATDPPFRILGTPQRSDTDYTPQTLAGALPTISQYSSGADPEVGTQNHERLPGPGDLTRLGDQTALSACLAEIGAEHAGGPLVFDVVDYARFQGLPALVVRFTDASGTSWAWVSGPECGVPGSGSDARFRTRVG